MQMTMRKRRNEDMHKKKKELTGESPVPETVNNNLYVGSTSDLLKIINKSDE